MTPTPAQRPAQAAFSAESNTLFLQGDWTLPHYAKMEALLPQLAARLNASTTVNAAALGALDTAGAQLLQQLLGEARLQTLIAEDSLLPAERRALLQAVAQALSQTQAAPLPPKQNLITRLTDHLEALGRLTLAGWRHVHNLLGFAGLVLEGMARVAWRPARWRVTSWMANLDQTTLRAVPIVALMNFMVGAVVAFLGATVLRSFGASIFTVNLVAFAFLREFGVLLAAILVAGRTASAFAAQIGSMRANEEVDAIRVQGLDPVEMLVIPRVLALLLGLPVLTLIAVLSGIFGGMVVCALELDISMQQFLAIVQDSVPPRHFYLGLGKAPIMAFMIALIGCAEGFKVSGSAQSVGEHTTSAVVQSIFTVILIDALAALFFMEMDW
ncbi:MAG: ABC transporter permease [Brachymonas sp.]|nr:ABC transporter permease [Brachymonas sp.]